MDTIDEVKYPDIKVHLAGLDSNAGTIVGAVTSAMRKAGVSTNMIDQFRYEAYKGDYTNLLNTAMAWVDCFPDEGE